MNKVSFFNETNELIIEEKNLKKLIKYAIKHEKLKNVVFNVIFVDNDKIKELNTKYRHIDNVTDVISFALEDNKTNNYGKIRMLGDIYISINKAKEQSIEYNHSYLRELSFLMIHGFLHLIGYDHKDIDDEKIMINKQEEILNGYGIKR
jgi:probable rRNA maturation factor